MPFHVVTIYRLSGQPSPPALAVLSDLAAEAAHCSNELPEQCVDLVCLEGGESAHNIPREIPAPEFLRPYCSYFCLAIKGVLADFHFIYFFY